MTFLLAASPCVSILWAFVNMSLCTLRSFGAVAKSGKVSTDWGGRVDANMSIATRRIGTFATKEM